MLNFEISFVSLLKLKFNSAKDKEIAQTIKLLKDFKHIKLHMIGKLQTNKVKYVVPLFDYIHSVDNLKLAEKISKEQIKNNKMLKLFIQINIGNENQKNGIAIEELDNFYIKCTQELGLNIIGIMCLPPNDNNSSNYFSKTQQLANQLQLKARFL